MHPNANIAMDTILIGVAFLTIGISFEGNFLFVSSASVAQQTLADSKSTPSTSTEYTQSTSTTTERYPKLFGEDDNFGKENLF